VHLLPLGKTRVVDFRKERDRTPALAIDLIFWKIIMEAITHCWSLHHPRGGT